MNMNIQNLNNNAKKQRILLTPDIILRYLISDDDKTDTMILCKTGDIDLVTTDLNLYEALGSIQNYDDFKFPKLKKLFEVVDVVSHRDTTKQEKPILKDARVEEIRKKALKQG